MDLGYYSFTVPAVYDGLTARNYLRKVCGLTARSMTALKYAEGGMTRGGVLLRSCDTVHTGDVIELRLPAEINEIIPVEGALDILYEDAYLLVVDKPPFMPVHPTKVHQLDTLANIVAFYQQQIGESYVFRALNRLDKDTSGCVLIAKDRLSYVLTQPTVKKRYSAVCKGVLTEGGVIDAPIDLAQDSKIRRTVSDSGKHAVTQYMPVQSGNGHTLLSVTLLTGRTHQIRCHMSSIGHPLAGDDLYGGSLGCMERQALHCSELSFLHPVTKESVSLSAPIPQAFFRILDGTTVI